MRSVHLAARIARYVWAAPCTAVGLCLVAPAFLFGAPARVVDGAIEVPRGLIIEKSIYFLFNSCFSIFKILNKHGSWIVPYFDEFRLKGRL
jgi:hypothetical protein